VSADDETRAVFNRVGDKLIAVNAVAFDSDKGVTVFYLARVRANAMQKYAWYV